MTKVKNYGNVTIVDDVTTEAQEHDPFYDWWMLHRADTRIVKKNFDFTIGDTFDMSSQDDSKDTDHLTFSAVSGDWHGYMMDRFNCKDAKRHLSNVTNLSENVLFVSDSFDMTELENLGLEWTRVKT